MYAIIDDGGKQYRVAEGDRIEIDRRELEPGTAIEFDRVLLLSGDDGITIGQPTVADAKVQAVVEAETKGKKLIIMHFRRRKDSRVRTGHRQKYTAIRIEKIVTG